MPTEHTVSAFSEELAALDRTVLAMGGLVEAQTSRAISSCFQRDSGTAAEVLRKEHEVDSHEQAILEQVERIFALRQPVAQDLRCVLAALQTATNLERVGDLAESIAKRSIVLCEIQEVPGLWIFPRFGAAAHDMLRDVLDSYGNRDEKKAKSVWTRDAELDDMYASICRELMTHMIEDPRRITPGVHLLFIAKNLERIADHATNIAELVDYMLTGDRTVDGRPRGNVEDVEGPSAPMKESP